ncbi:EAL domain-containing protein [Allohahella sp. A8]|uniref:EAL domain-containing protein n=1 Tax=Allohahella sp. A8 TaxID=3141461 RepID=UPI0026877635
MKPSRSSALVRDITAVVALAVVLLMQWAADPLARNAPFILIYPVVFLSAWFFGRRSATLVTLLGAIAAAYLFMQPYQEFNVQGAAARGRLLTFVLVSLAMAQVLHWSRQHYLQLKISEARYDFATTVARIGTWEWDLTTDLIYGSTVLRSLFGLPDVEKVLTAEKMIARIHPDDQTMVRQRLMEAIERKSIYEAEFRILTAEGTPRWILGKGRCVYDSRGRPIQLIGTNVDTTELRAAEKALRESENQYRTLAAAVPAGIFRSDVEGECIYTNSRLAQMYGMRSKQILGSGWINAVHVHDRRYVAELWRTTSRQGVAFDAEYRVSRPDGRVVWVTTQAAPERSDDGTVIGFVGVVTEITERKNYEESLRLQASTDDLTKLANRAFATERLQLEVEHARSQNTNVALMFIDLDNFMHVNDTLGHEVGDELLKQTAGRLGTVMQEGQLLARFGGDEFLIILPNLARVELAERTAEQVVESFARPFVLNGSEAFVTCSVGIAVYPGDGENYESLLRHADIALYRAKETGRNNYQFFLEEMNAQLRERQELELNLRYALERDELSVHYQPIVMVQSGKVAGFESLLRWQNSAMGNVSPERFIALAEENGMIAPIGNWLLQTACLQMRKWQIATGEDLQLAVNISANQLRTDELFQTLQSVIKDSGFPPHLLELELTERSLIQDDLVTEASLHKICKEGIRFAIDDFGTGYSNLGYLQRLPLHSLKLDRSFLTGAPQHVGNTTLARTIITMSHSLGLSVIAEGIECEAQLEFLRDECCDFVQGYYFARPMEAAVAEQWLMDHLAAFSLGDTAIPVALPPTSQRSIHPSTDSGDGGPST